MEEDNFYGNYWDKISEDDEIEKGGESDLLKLLYELCI